MNPPSNRAELETHALAYVILYTQKYNSKYPDKPAKPPAIFPNLRGETIGRAYFNRSRTSYIRLNPTLILQNPESLEETVVHELAHIFAKYWATYRIKPHGWEWSQTMYHLGWPPKVTHDYDVAACGARKTQKYQYTCPCGRIHKVGPKLHKQCQNNEQEYWCTNCRTDLRDMRVIDLGKC